MLPLNFNTLPFLMFVAIFLSYPCMFLVSFIIMKKLEGTFIDKLWSENMAFAIIVSYLLGLACTYFVFNAWYSGGGPDLPGGPSRRVGPFEY